MNKQEAIQQINLIHEALELGNKAYFSGAKLILFGSVFLLLPVLEWATRMITFGYDLAHNKTAAIIATLIHIAFYSIIYLVIGRLIDAKTSSPTSAKTHPLLKKAFAIHRPMIFATMGVVVVMIALGQEQFAYPIAYLFIGVFMNLFGRFSLKPILYISWSYLVLGLIYAFLTQYQFEYIWMYFSIYMGITYIMMGWLLCKQEKLVC